MQVSSHFGCAGDTYSLMIGYLFPRGHLQIRLSVTSGLYLLHTLGRHLLSGGSVGVSICRYLPE